jgi:hypothetical protein
MVEIIAEERRVDAIQALGDLVDLVGIEPTTSSMPCSFQGSRSLVFKHLRTGISGRNGVVGALSGQFPAKNFDARSDELHGRGL